MVENSHNQNLLKQSTELLNQSTEKEESFYKHILLVSSSIFGILISLHSTNSQPQHIRWVFLCSIILLALGILSTIIVFRSYSKLLKKALQTYNDELLKSQIERRQMNCVFAKQSKITIVCKAFSLTFLTLAIIFLTLYSFLITH